MGGEASRDRRERGSVRAHTVRRADAVLPLGTERSDHGLRLARQLLTEEGVELEPVLMADAVGCAKDGRTTPNG